MKQAPSPALLHNFLEQWRAHYRSRPDLEYDPAWLWQMFVIYWNFGKMVMGADHELYQANQKQWDSYKIMIQKPESLHHQSRRSGKTLKLSHGCVFFAELGFGETKGKVIFRTPHQNQLKGLKQWLKFNPFFVKFRKSDYEADLFECPFALDLACLSPATTTGLECSVLIEDEYSTIPKDSELYIWMMDTRAFLAKGMVYKKRHIHASSGRKTTPFEDDYFYIIENDPSAYFKMAWYETTWITQDYINKEKKKMFDASYWIEEQYECLWVQAHGNFFDDKNLHIVDAEFLSHFAPNVGGLDWNGNEVGHILGIGFWDGTDLYLMDELQFKTVQEVSRFCKQHPELEIEVEGKPNTMGFNAGYSDHLQALDTPCSYQNWIEQDENIKDRRLAMMQRAQIYCTNKSRWFIKNHKEATFDPKTKTGIPKLMKLPDQHGLDYGLHMLHGGGNLDITAGNSYAMSQDIEAVTDIIHLRSRI